MSIKRILFFTIIILFISLVSISKFNLLGVIFLPSIIYLMINIKDSDLLFNITLFISIALGSSYNLKYQISIFTLTDLCILILLISIILRFGINVLRYKIIYILLSVMIGYFLIGIISNYKFYSIAQDLKLYIYAFVFILYFYNLKKEGYNLNKKYFRVNTFLIVLFIFFQEIMHLNKIGLYNMINTNFSQRDVGISVQFLPIIAGVIMFINNSKEYKINKFYYNLMQVLIFISVIISFTRSVWLQYILSILCTSIIITLYYKKIYFLKLIILVFIIITTTGVVFPSINNNIRNAIFDRLLSIKLIQRDNHDTLQGRFDVSNNLIKEKFNLRIIVGYGMGDQFGTSYFLEKPRTFVENSILNIIWKYGLIISFFIIYKAIESFILMIKTKNKISQITLLQIFIFLAIGNFSGVPTQFYFVSILIFYCMFLSVEKEYSELFIVN